MKPVRPRYLGKAVGAPYFLPVKNRSRDSSNAIHPSRLPKNRGVRAPSPLPAPLPTLQATASLPASAITISVSSGKSKYVQTSVGRTAIPSATERVSPSRHDKRGATGQSSPHVQVSAGKNRPQRLLWKSTPRRSPAPDIRLPAHARPFCPLL